MTVDSEISSGLSIKTVVLFKVSDHKIILFESFQTTFISGLKISDENALKNGIISETTKITATKILFFFMYYFN